MSFEDTWLQLSKLSVPALAWPGQAAGASGSVPGGQDVFRSFWALLNVVTWPIPLAYLSLGPTGISERGRGNQGH